ncbi:VOC family protein [Actinomadura atramentaria]|uniref:VOC family protein n=1 Tax=Actinomadura atramentaria TaxID=1990 RepID=UPI0003698547|nr:VOC family protein [Actinomadura atramentaria]
MTVRRIVPDIRTDDMAAASDFYAAIGLEVVMDHGWVVTLASPSNPTAQLTLQGADAHAAVHPDVSIEVEDVDAVYRAMLARGAEIVHDLRDEEWGVRRFFVRDPAGAIVNVVGHR